MISHSASVCTTASGSSCSSFADGAGGVGMQGCRERGGVYIQRIEKSTALDQVWHGFLAPEPPWFRWFGAAKVCKPAAPSPAATLPPPHRCYAPHQRRGILDEGGVRLIAVWYRPIAVLRIHAAFDCFRLTAVSQLKNVTDCCYPKQSLDRIFLAGPLYT